MELSFARCETILNTLPIGYYAGRRIECMLDEKEETSFYSPMEDKIVVSYPIIANRMKRVPDTANDEEAVRSMLYHEVSHAIMTNTFCIGSSNVENIFEDERIETVLKDYYLNTDFKKQLVEIHGGIPEATNVEQAFFNAVRFRHAPDNILDTIQDIIDEYGDLIRVGEEERWWEYRRAIYNLYDKVRAAFRKHPEQFQPQPGEKGNPTKALDSIKSKMGEEGNEYNKSTSGNGNDNTDNERGNEDGTSVENDSEENDKSKQYSDQVSDKLSEEQRQHLREMFGGGLSKTPLLGRGQKKALDEFTKTAELIIGNFNKKNAGGSGINAYSGVFNPRAVTRQDYRFFERSMSTQGNNKFGTCHLNLFIDCSGSMSDNEEIVNGMLQALSDIERKNRNFSMDVIFIDHKYHECTTVRDRQFHATGSNDIPSDMKEKFLAHQLPNTCNYNIVLFDGDVYCMASRGIQEEVRRFSAFDYKQTTVIIDPSNKRYLGDGFKSAKVVLTTRYATELLNHVTKALTIAFG